MNEANPTSGTGCGALLARARQAAGLDVEDVSTRLKMPVRIVEALEREDFACLGAPIFVRGQLRSYARLVGIDLEGHLAQVERETAVPAVLVSHTHTPRARRLFDQLTRRMAYVAITAAILVPIWLATEPHLSGTLAVDTLEPATLSTPDAPAPQPTPVVASMAPMAPARVEQALSLRFEGNSWLEVIGPDGVAIERGEVPAGQLRSYQAGQVGRVVLGNANAVRVVNNGRMVDAAAFSRANVARFTLSSDGSVTPLND